MVATSSSSAAAAAGSGGGLPAPPPPTPSGHPFAASNSTVANDDLSRLLHRLLTAPTLSSSPLPRRLRPPSSSASPPPPPLISLHHHPNLLSAAATTHGFFHLIDHVIPSHLPAAALSEAHSTITTTPSRSRLGFDSDADCSHAHQVFDASLGDLDELPALQEYALCLQNAALEVVDMLAGAGEGFPENPFRNGTVKPRCLMWASTSSATEGDEEETGGRWEEVKSYPYVVCLQYEMSAWRKPCWVLDGDSGAWIPVVPVADSVLVTFGDIAQVWSNGRFKKMRGIPQPNLRKSFDDHNHLSLSLLVTLPVDTIVSPLPLTVSDNCDGGGGSEEDDNEKRFRAFPFDDYAWKVYHERLPFKDRLIRYRN